MLLNSAVQVDLDEFRDGKPIQLTVAAPVLESGLPPGFTSSDVMFILGEGFEATPIAVETVEFLGSRGYRFVLENLPSNPHLGALLRHSYAVRVDTAGMDTPALNKHMDLLSGAKVEMVADHIGSYEELRAATKQGFTLFQGSFLSRPNGFRKTRVPTSQLAGLELITLLQNPDAEISELADVIRRDVNLSYRILKVVNSAQYSLPRPLGSIEEAVVLVGTQQIVSWVGAMTMSGLNNKPAELTRLALIRARACETLAGKLERGDTQRFYLVGLFSVIEALLDVPAEAALGDLPLDPEIFDALTSRGGIMGELLTGVEAYERADFANASVVGLPDHEMSPAYHSAVLETDLMWSKISS